MTERIALSIDASGLSSGLSEAGAEIARIAENEIAPAAALIEEVFSTTARSIERDLSRAARTGSLSLKSLANSIVGDLKRVAVDTLVRKPLESLVASAFGGARAGGGFVAAGAHYLVGERGPELFTPAVSGQIGAPAPAPVTVNITLPGVSNAESFRQSETQIAAALARALAKGQRNL
ncbi:MAG: phage tail tape measure C-terminal domain-containing protein [Amphiplicatus sp.]